MRWQDIVAKTAVHKALEEVLKTGKPFCPDSKDIFRAFELLSPDKIRVCLTGMDPYPQKGIATGILFANKKNTPEDKLSPSLRIIKNSFLEYLQVSEKDITFDPSLVYLTEQGVLMINSALTVEENNPGSHSLIWRPFTSQLLHNLSRSNPDIIFILFGQQAQSFRPYIDSRNCCFETFHPAYFARKGGETEKSGILLYAALWMGINLILHNRGEKEINWLNQ